MPLQGLNKPFFDVMQINGQQNLFDQSLLLHKTSCGLGANYEKALPLTQSKKHKRCRASEFDRNCHHKRINWKIYRVIRRIRYTSVRKFLFMFLNKETTITIMDVALVCLPLLLNWNCPVRDHVFGKIFPKTQIFKLLIRTRTCAHLSVRNEMLVFR